MGPLTQLIHVSPCLHPPHVHPLLGCRDLLGMLENPLEDLALEYHATLTGSSESSPAAVLPTAVAAV